MGIDHIINEYHHLMKKENFGCKDIIVEYIVITKT